MIEEATIYPIGQAPTTFTVGTANVASIEASGTAGATWWLTINYDDGSIDQYVGVPYLAKIPA